LPHQSILENFVHHNPLECLQAEMSFNQALTHVQEIDAYMSPGERMLLLTGVDVRSRANDALVELCSSFLDRGAAKWTPNARHRGFLHFFASLEGLGVARWRAEARKIANDVLQKLDNDNDDVDRLDDEKLIEIDEERRAERTAAAVVLNNLEFFGTPPDELELMVHALLFELRGWAGMFQRMQTHPAEAPRHTRVRLLDFCAVQTTLMRASLVAQARAAGWQADRLSFGEWLGRVARSAEHEPHESVHSASAVAFVDQDAGRREAMEANVEQLLLTALQSAPLSSVDSRRDTTIARPTMQVYTCIDDREGSLRRHVEEASDETSAVETFGVAGFFGLPIDYRPSDGREPMINAPEGAAISATLIEMAVGPERELSRYRRRRRALARAVLTWERLSTSPLGSLALSTLLPLTLTRLALMGYFPRAKQWLRDTFERTLLRRPRTEFELPFTADLAAEHLSRTFAALGQCETHRFAPLVVVLGHGASSVNNPFAAAYNCGACSGHDGGSNARLFARAANDSDVRRVLRERYAIDIPSDVVFIGGLHNTTADTITLYDEHSLPSSHQQALVDAKRLLADACAQNALERCQRFLLTDVDSPEAALRHVGTRSIDAAEVRPELNHSSNAGVIVGRRELTLARFFDRRVFLPSYDPFSDDDRGTTNSESVVFSCC
jgi:uncharacterized protein YbcC (UPF0753/DUF2309 family)